MTRKKLPIGIQTFREIREEGSYYVDKTGQAVDLVQSGKAFFLSRPRRFGKSLFLDTLKELFEGNRELFAGLEAEDRWDWSVRYPVIRISFGGGQAFSAEDLRNWMHRQMEESETDRGLVARALDTRGRLHQLIQGLHRQSGQRVVVLVDEYDKPILDHLEQPELARQMRDVLRDFYGVLKDA
ncbi:MAG: AAA family ATPase, partial [Candidatus Sericytochromatia bacterium]|nr:AAA family ATPase [Candidatus Sericytochromatia bacterium]